MFFLLQKFLEEWGEKGGQCTYYHTHPPHPAPPSYFYTQIKTNFSGAPAPEVGREKLKMHEIKPKFTKFAFH